MLLELYFRKCFFALFAESILLEIALYGNMQPYVKEYIMTYKKVLKVSTMKAIHGLSGGGFGAN